MSRPLFIIAAFAFAAVANACQNPDGPESAVRGPLPQWRSTVSGLPHADTLRQPGLEFTITVSGPAAIREVFVLVDSGTTAELKYSVPTKWLAGAPAPSPGVKQIAVLVPPAVANGRHRFTAVIVDSAGASLDTSFTYVVAVTDLPYTVRVLSIPSGGTTYASAINAAGDIAGSAVDATGVSRATVWHGDVARQLGTGGSIPSAASSINDLGDVGGYTMFSSPETIGTLWTADGTMRLFADSAATFANINVVNNKRVVAGIAWRPYTSPFGPGRESFGALYDVTTGLLQKIPVNNVVAMNNKAQGISMSRVSSYLTTIGGFGEGLSIVIPHLRPGAGDMYERGFQAWPYGIDDAGDVLAALEGELFLSQSTTAQYLTQRLPAGPVATGGAAIAPGGDVVSRASSDSIFIWNERAGTRRVVLPDRSWSIDYVYRMNDRGEIIGQATNAQTGRTSAIVLSPR